MPKKTNMCDVEIFTHIREKIVTELKLGTIVEDYFLIYIQKLPTLWCVYCPQSLKTTQPAKCYCFLRHASSALPVAKKVVVRLERQIATVYAYFCVAVVLLCAIVLAALQATFVLM